MSAAPGSSFIDDWPEESREAARLVVRKYGEPDEATESRLVWYRRGPWKRIVAQKTFFRHFFPIEHTDSVETFIDYRVPPDRVSDLAAFDGSVIVERTAGEVSARCHDEEANLLALNLMHDIVTGQKTVQQAREYYAEEFLRYRRREPTPYMERLHFAPEDESTAPDPDEAVLTEADLEYAKQQGERQRPGARA